MSPQREMCSIYSQIERHFGWENLLKIRLLRVVAFFKQLVFIFECDAGRGRNARPDSEQWPYIPARKYSIHILAHFRLAGATKAHGAPERTVQNSLGKFIQPAFSDTFFRSPRGARIPSPTVVRGEANLVRILHPWCGI